MGCWLLGVEEKPDTDIIAKVNEQPALAFSRLGKGITGYFGLPFAGHSMHELGFRHWKYAQRLYANTCEFVATGAVQSWNTDPFPFSPFTQIPHAEPEVRITRTQQSDTEIAWSVGVSNPGSAPVVCFSIQNSSSREGADFDFRVSENFFTLFGHESKRLTVQAISIPGHSVPADLDLCWYAWNSPTRNVFDPLLRAE
jgi:hypothetical protein